MSLRSLKEPTISGKECIPTSLSELRVVNPSYYYLGTGIIMSFFHYLSYYCSGATVNAVFTDTELLFGKINRHKRTISPTPACPPFIGLYKCCLVDVALHLLHGSTQSFRDCCACASESFFFLPPVKTFPFSEQQDDLVSNPPFFAHLTLRSVAVL